MIINGLIPLTSRYMWCCSRREVYMQILIRFDLFVDDLKKKIYLFDIEIFKMLLALISNWRSINLWRKINLWLYL